MVLISRSARSFFSHLRPKAFWTLTSIVIGNWRRRINHSRILCLSMYHYGPLTLLSLADCRCVSLFTSIRDAEPLNQKLESWSLPPCKKLISRKASRGYLAYQHLGEPLLWFGLRGPTNNSTSSLQLKAYWFPHSKSCLSMYTWIRMNATCDELMMLF